MSKKEKPSLDTIVGLFLKKRGWHTWYNENYWVNAKTVKDPTRQNYTYYGMDMQSAFVHEVEGLDPFDIGPFGLEGASRYQTKVTDVLEYYFKGAKDV